MTLEEFSNGFDTLVNSYRRFKDFDKEELLDSIEFSEYEKSLFLTQAQKELVVESYNGKNPFNDSFESTEEIRRMLDSLVKTKVYSDSEKAEGVTLNERHVLYQLPSDLAFITLEQVVYGDDALGCYDGSTARVYPITQDEYTKITNNPFRGPTRYKVLRLDSGDNVVELITKYKILSYTIKYLSVPSPIILENLPEGVSIEGETQATECTLNNIFHDTILKRAVQLALVSKGHTNK